MVWEVHRPTIADNGDPVAVSLCGLHRPATSAYSKEIPGKLLACCVSVWNASARRLRIILKGTWLTAQTVIGELSGLFIGIRAPRGYPDCLKTVPAVSVSNSYQWIFGYSNYLPRLTVHVGHIIFFPVPRAGLFSVKIRKKFLAIQNFFVNETMSGQPNKRLIHWHFEN